MFPHILCLAYLFINRCSSVDPLADSTSYVIKWAGPIETEPKSQSEDLLSMVMVTKNNEQYQCKYQQMKNQERSSQTTYTGPSAVDIIKLYTSSTACSYRIESYWSYELCHGKHLRQYHEEKNPASETGVLVTQQYFLGKYLKDKSVTEGESVPKIQLEGTSYPYHLVEYDDGTLCDLTSAPRRTSVYYICYENGRGEIYEIKEVSTCEYSVVVLLDALCNHPSYRLNKEHAQVISCYSLMNAPDKPAEQEAIDNALQQTSGATILQPSGIRRQPVAKPVVEHTKEELDATRTDIGKNEDEIFMKQFLSGDHCLQGGSGWWSYEFCYGKFVKQFHAERGKRVTNILLGEWNKQVHLDWLTQNPNKKPKSLPNRKYISQLYSGGDVCDETKKSRVVEVKLKCIQAASSHAVAIYLLEPSTCEYILTIESPLLCNVVERADDFSLIT